MICLENEKKNVTLCEKNELYIYSRHVVEIGTQIVPSFNYFKSERMRINIKTESLETYPLAYLIRKEISLYNDELF